MLDVSHIPSSQQDTQIFYAAGSTSWQTWVKPRGAKFIQIFCLGGGGGGGGGGTNTAASSTNAGGGGAASGHSRAIYPSSIVPDTLYIQVGVGGSGGAGRAAGSGGNGVAGSNGGLSYVALAPTSTVTTLLLASAASTTPAGNASSVGGSAPGIWSISTSPFTALGIVTGSIGVAGGSGGPTPSNLTALSTNIVTGGAGGGQKPANTQATGSSIISSSVLLLSNVNGGAPGGGIGESGYGTLAPFCGTGGAGGGGNLSGGGGRGGNGWYGCGGGGGGGGLSSANTGGAGGNGGDGLVIITTIF